jgi:ketosteroid isomerase-like protein
MTLDVDKLTPEERALAEQLTRSSWAANGENSDNFRTRDLDKMADHVTPDVISVPANRRALRSREELKAWYAKRMGDYDMNVESRVDAIDIVGDLAIVAGVFRVTRRPEQGLPGVDHAGRYLAVYKKGDDGKWRVWRDMDTPSPDADVFYTRLERGW